MHEIDFSCIGHPCLPILHQGTGASGLSTSAFFVLCPARRPSGEHSRPIAFQVPLHIDEIHRVPYSAKIITLHSYRSEMAQLSDPAGLHQGNLLQTLSFHALE